MSNKFENSTVYKICCKNENVKEVYIGSTTDFKRRIRQHKHRCRSEKDSGYNCFLYQFIRQNGGWENFELNIIERCEVENKQQLLERERHYILQNDNKLNKVIVGRTLKEYYEDNKQKIKAYQEKYQEKYRELNKEKINEKMNCICGGKYTRQHKSTHEKTKKHQEFIKNNDN